MKMNDDGETATIGAGVNLHDATMYLRKHNRGFKTTPAYGNITIGGATGTGAHGSTIKYNASLSSQMVGIRIVDGNGEIQDIFDAEDLKAFRIHLGLLGVVLSVTFHTVPIYKTLANNYITTEDILLNGQAIKMARETDQMSLYWVPEFKEVVVANWTIVDANTKGDAFTYDHVPSIYANTAAVVAKAAEAAFTLTSSTCPLANTIGRRYGLSNLSATMMLLVLQVTGFCTRFRISLSRFSLNQFRFGFQFTRRMDLLLQCQQLATTTSCSLQFVTMNRRDFWEKHAFGIKDPITSPFWIMSK